MACVGAGSTPSARHAARARAPAGRPAGCSALTVNPSRAPRRTPFLCFPDAHAEAAVGGRVHGDEGPWGVKHITGSIGIV